MEEKVLSLIEQPVSRDLGEYVRSEYGPGSLVRTRDVTSCEEAQ